MQNHTKISPRQISLFTEEKSTSSQEDFLVSHTATQGNDLERKMTATSGRKCLEQLERFSHVGSWAKMFLALLVGTREWYSMRCRLTWKMKGTRYNRLYFQLLPSTLPTEETEFGLLPTASARDWKGERALTDGKNKSHTTGTTYGIRLEQAVRDIPEKYGLLPTPKTFNGTPNGKKASNAEQGGRHGVEFNELAVKGLLPTPRANDMNHPQTNGKAWTHRKERKYLAENVMPEPKDGQTSQLNPRFVLEMMGFPPDWTVSPFLSGETNPSKPQEMQ